MSSLITTWILLIFLALPCFAGNPAQGPNYAIVIIDMQNKFIDGYPNNLDFNNARKVNEVLKQQLYLINMAKTFGIPLIFMEYEDWGPTNSKLLKAASNYKDVKIFIKNTDGMFSVHNKGRVPLKKYLDERKIGNLIIAGANGGACVHKSIEGSLQNQYNVLAFSQGIVDFNSKDFIYPYAGHYNFKPLSESCKFQELDRFDQIGATLITDYRSKNKVSVNSSDRSTRKESRGPVFRPQRFGSPVVPR